MEFKDNHLIELNGTHVVSVLLSSRLGITLRDKNHSIKGFIYLKS